MNNFTGALIFIFSLLVAIPATAQDSRKKVLRHADFKEGIALLDSDPDRAFVLMQREVEHHPRNGYAWFCLSMLYHTIEERPALALNAANKAVALLEKDPEYLAKSYSLRSEIYESINRDSLALADINALLARHIDDDMAYELRAAFYLTHARYDLALADYTVLTQRSPSNLTAYLGQGEAHAMLGDRTEALRLFDYATRLDPDDPRPFMCRSEFFRQEGNYRRACHEVIVAHVLQANCGDVLAQMLDIAAVAYDTLDIALTEAELMEPQRGSLFYMHAMVAERTQHYAEAVNLFEKSAEIFPDVDPLVHIAYCHHALGHTAEAIAAARKALALDSSLTELQDDMTQWESELATGRKETIENEPQAPDIEYYPK